MCNKAFACYETVILMVHKCIRNWWCCLWLKLLSVSTFYKVIKILRNSEYKAQETKSVSPGTQLTFIARKFSLGLGMLNHMPLVLSRTHLTYFFLVLSLFLAFWFKSILSNLVIFRSSRNANTNLIFTHLKYILRRYNFKRNIVCLPMFQF